MAGHSQFANIMHRKGRQDAKRASMFNKLVREIMVSAKQGLPDAEHNPRLRAAIAAAKAQSVPRDRIEKAIKSAQPGNDDGKVYEELRYEGFGPSRVALIIDILTDNRNRTAPEIRTILSKNGGHLGESNSVSFMFQRVGQITYPASVGHPDKVLEAAIEAGAEDVVSNEQNHTIYTNPEDLAVVAVALEKGLGESEYKLAWKPTTTVMLDIDGAQSLMNLIDKLEDHDDVQAIYANYELSDEVAAALAAA